MTAAEFLAPLQSVKGSSARCPAHDDKNASLSVTERNGKVLIHCHAGCTPEAVCEARGVTLADLFAENRNGHAEITATYDYKAADGNLLFQVCRLFLKSFRQRRPDGSGGWVWSMAGIDPVLFRMPEI